MSVETLEQALARGRERLPGGRLTADRRAAAMQALSAVGLPTTRRESWRYTDLRPVAGAAFDWVPSAPSAAAIGRATERLAAAGLSATGTRLVFVDGHHVAALGRSSSATGIEIKPLQAHWPRFEEAALAPIAVEEHPLAGLNTAFAHDGAWLDVPAGVKAAEPIELVFVASGAGALAPQPRIVVRLGEGAALALVQHFLDCGDPEGWLNTVTEIEQGPGSRLDLIRVQEHGAGQVHTALVTAKLQADAELVAGFVDLGGRLVRSDIDVDLLERGARTELFGLFVPAAGRHIDDHVSVNHVGPETRSEQLFRGIVGRRGRGVFNGKVIVQRNAQRIDARQSNDNLLLSDQAEIDAKPELEIYADDVKCSHGSTIGELDPEHLFYLRSRGIGDDDARTLLTTAFAEVVLERVHDAALRGTVSARTAGLLAELAVAARSAA